MTGAMYAGIAGLKTHMQNLNVIGNNIANINTDGYKAGRSVFQTALYTQIRGGSDGSSTTGARNPAQLGYGVAMGTVDIDMSTGNLKPTGKSTDCMLDGDGFFLFGDKTVANMIDPSDPSTFTALTLGRVGDIEIKSDGYLANRNGDVVYGFLCVGTYTEDNIAGAPAGTKPGDPMFSDQLVPIRLPGMEEIYVDGNNNQVIAEKQDDGTIKYYKATYQDGKLTKGDQIDKPEDIAKITTTKRVRYPTAYVGATPTDPRPVTDGKPAAAERLDDAKDENGEYLPYAQFDTISFDEKTGLISGTTKDTSQRVIIGMFAIGNVTNPNGVTQVSATQYKAGAGSGDLTITTLGNAGKDVGIEYVNGSLHEARRAADPTLPAELGDRARVNSAGSTALVTGGLEMSKTDLATEIANMITTQRGYQANTRIITVTDSMLEELVNMKR